jgi:aspartate/methionine/tyrosine aminotransferase
MPAMQESRIPFSITHDDPFIIFRKLQAVARESKGADVIDLSRGDPGYGFVPSVKGRAFASYILHLDSIVNASSEDRFLQYAEKDEAMLIARIHRITDELYQPDTTKRMKTLLDEFIKSVIASARDEGKQWKKFDVLRELFAFCSMSGGSYLNPKGQELTRIVVAAWHRSELGIPLTSEDINLTNGVSHGIGTLFKALGEEGCGFLQKGDAVAITSPVYAPYNGILEERGLKTFPISMNHLTGTVNGDDKKSLAHAKNPPKILCLIDPNNPTGFALPEAEIKELAAIAEAQNMLIITDEVYASFFPKKKTMLHYAPKRTIMLNARSKIERSTGLRFGEIVTTPNGRENIEKMLELDRIQNRSRGSRTSATEEISNEKTFEKLLLFAKAPGRTGGQFQHTTFVPGPSQLLGTAHIILGKEEREQYKEDLKHNCDVFGKELSLPHKNNLYYIVFDLDTIPGCSTQNIPMEERLIRLAKAGIVYIPAYRFFAEKDRGNPGISTSVRASVVNTTPEKLREAARRTREVLTSPPGSPSPS